MAYLTPAEFKLLATIPSSFVDIVDTRDPGYTAAQLDYWSQWIDARLRKRYDAPFHEPYPVAVKGWLARIVTIRVWSKRGVDPEDQQWLEAKTDDAAARDEIKEAANSEVGLFDLPMRADTRATGIAFKNPGGYAEASPYVWTTTQAKRGRDEDDRGGGSYS